MSRNLLSAKAKVKTVTIDGEEINLRTWSLGERVEFGRAADKKDGSAATLVVRFSVCDADGKPAFTAQDDAAIAAMDGSIAQGIIDEALIHNKLNKGEVEAEKKG